MPVGPIRPNSSQLNRLEKLASIDSIDSIDSVGSIGSESVPLCDVLGLLEFICVGATPPLFEPIPPLI